jgi:hypothetical protein
VYYEHVCIHLIPLSGYILLPEYRKILLIDMPFIKILSYLQVYPAGFLLRFANSDAGD